MSHRIEWRHDGRRVVLPVLLLAPQPSTDLSGMQATALLDTGSTTSGLTARAAKFLGLTGRGKRPLGSAQGEGQAERYLFRFGITIDNEAPAFPSVFEDVIGFELADSFTLDALIGMDVLRTCDFSIDHHGRCAFQFG